MIIIVPATKTPIRLDTVVDVINDIVFLGHCRYDPRKIELKRKNGGIRCSS